MMEKAIKALQNRLDVVQLEIVARDHDINQYRDQIKNAKFHLALRYKERDELADAIFKLRKAR